MSNDDTDVDSWEDYDSGSFCRHYGDPDACEEPCERCGHKCTEHGGGWGSDEPCSREGCACPGWVGVT